MTGRGGWGAGTTWGTCPGAWEGTGVVGSSLLGRESGNVEKKEFKCQKSMTCGKTKQTQ